MGLELQLEDVVLMDAVGVFGGADGVAEQREAGQREVILRAEVEINQTLLVQQSVHHNKTITIPPKYTCHRVTQTPLRPDPSDEGSH